MPCGQHAVRDDVRPDWSRVSHTVAAPFLKQLVVLVWACATSDRQHDVRDGHRRDDEQAEPKPRTIVGRK